MGNQDLLDKIESTWDVLMTAYAGLTPEQMEQPGVTGDWSVKDILAHVTTWEEESLKQLPLMAAKVRAPSYEKVYGGTDAFNALMAAEKRDLPLDTVLQRLSETHRRLVEYVAAAPAEQFSSRARGRARLGWDSFKHYPDHAQAIRDWRSRMGF